MKVLIWIFSIVLAFLVGAYVVQFSSSEFSDNPEHWGQFGDYFSMIVNLAGTVAIFILSYLVFQNQKERDKWEKALLEISETPILIFAADNNVYNRCLNVGKGGAHNVLIGKISFTGNKAVIKSYSIPANGYVKILWSNDPNELFAYYENINGKKFLVHCKDDVNSVLFKGLSDLKGNEFESTVEWLKNDAQRHSGLSLRMI